MRTEYCFSKLSRATNYIIRPDNFHRTFTGNNFHSLITPLITGFYEGTYTQVYHKLSRVEKQIIGLYNFRNFRNDNFRKKGSVHTYGSFSFVPLYETTRGKGRVKPIIFVQCFSFSSNVEFQELLSQTGAFYSVLVATIVFAVRS